MIIISETNWRLEVMRLRVWWSEGGLGLEQSDPLGVRDVIKTQLEAPKVSY